MKSFTATNSQTKVKKKLLIFRGSTLRMKEVKSFLSQIDELEIIGAFSEEEGIGLFNRNGDIDLVLIGGRYTIAQRKNIKATVGNTKTTEPGIDYPYSNENIFLHVKNTF